MTKRGKAPAVRLAPDKVHAWRVERQLIGASGAGPEEIARALIGVQAQVLNAAALAVALRTKAARGKVARTDATTIALAKRRLVRAWGMRGTLHLFEADDFPTIVAALSRKEHWRRPAWLRYFEVSEAQMEAAIEAIGEILDDGTPRTRAELAGELESRLGKHAGELTRGSWGTFLSQAANKGYLCHATGDDNVVRLVRPSRWLGTWRDEDPEEALQALTLRYVAAYGPASIAELLRWWGVANQKDFRPAIDALGDALTEVEVDGDRGFVRTDDIGSIEDGTPARESVALLGPFDPFIVAAGLRGQLIPAAHLKRVSRTAGWISPVLLVDGRAAGVWDSTRKGDRLTVTVDPFEPIPRGQRAAVEAAAERVAGAQGATATVEYGPVFSAAEPAPED